MSDEQNYESTFRCRGWHTTVNNYDALDVENVRNHCSETSVKFGVLGYEVGEKGTPHLQVFVYYRHARTFRSVKNDLDGHVTAMYSDVMSSYEYCKKSGHFEEFGEIPQHGKQELATKAAADKWDQVWRHALNDDLNMIDASTRIHHYSALKRIYFDYQPAPEPLSGCCGFWWWGNPSTGKSQLARDSFPGDYYDKDLTLWWDGYENQSMVLIDDFDAESVNMVRFLKRWGDKYPFRGQIKGSSRWMRPKFVIITSNYSIDQLFRDPMSIKALKRRYEERHFDNAPFEGAMTRVEKPLSMVAAELAFRAATAHVPVLDDEHATLC